MRRCRSLLVARQRARRGVARAGLWQGCHGGCEQKGHRLQVQVYAASFAASHLRSCRGCGSALARRPVRGARTAHRRSRDGRARDRRRHRAGSPAPGTWPSAASTARSSRRARLPAARAAATAGSSWRERRPAHQDAIALFGHDIAVGIYRATLASEQRIYEIADEIGAAKHFARVGRLRVTWEPEELEHARVQYEAMRADDLPAEWVDEGDLPAIVRAPGRVGVFSPPDGTMHPARWVRAFSRAIEDRGVRIFERSPVPEPLDSRAQRRLRRPGRWRHRARPARRGGG